MPPTHTRFAAVPALGPNPTPSRGATETRKANASGHGRFDPCPRCQQDAEGSAKVVTVENIEVMWANAHAIASAHGHMWASNIPAVLCPILWGSGCWNACAESGDGYPVGRRAPTVDVDGISDSTATGRLRWHCWREGGWLLAVHRPEPTDASVLLVEGLPDHGGRGEHPQYTVNLEQVMDGNVHIRHLEALVPALKALKAYEPNCHVPDWVVLAGRFAADLADDDAAAWFAQLGAEAVAGWCEWAQSVRATAVRPTFPPYIGRTVEEEEV